MLPKIIIHTGQGKGANTHHGKAHDHFTISRIAISTIIESVAFKNRTSDEPCIGRCGTAYDAIPEFINPDRWRNTDNCALVSIALKNGKASIDRLYGGTARHGVRRLFQASGRI